MRWIGLGLLGLIGILGLGVVATYFLIGHVDFAAFAERRASAALGRTVTIGSLHVTPGRWLTIELDAVQVANLAGGSQPLMAELQHLSAEVEALSLLHGPANVRRATANGLALLLERVAGGQKNWKDGPDTPKPPDLTGREWFPALGEVTLHGSEITVVTSSGKRLRMKLDDVAVRAVGVDQPVRLTGSGDYEGTPVSLQGDLGSIAQIREVATPFPVTLHLASGDTTFDFKGTMTDPLGVDGAHGATSLAAPTAGPLLAIAGVRSEQDWSLQLAGTLDRAGDRWSLTGGSGKLDNNRIAAAALQLQEGGPGQPDDVQAEIGFDRLDLDAVLGGRGAPRSSADTSLAVERAPATLLAAKVSAREVVYAGFRGSDVKLDAALTPGLIAVKVLAFSYLGATTRASARIEPSQAGGRITADVSVAGADAGQFGRALSFGALPIAGRLDAAMAAEGDAATLNAAVRGARVSAVASMTGGSIARDVIEKASLDVRRLFRKPTGMTAVSCLLAVLDMRAGSGTLQPIRVRAADGTIAGNARFDLYRRWFDLTIGSQPSTTSAFALDIPVRVSGSFSNPTVQPAQWSAEGRALLASATNLGRLPSGLRDFARGNTCLSAR